MTNFQLNNNGIGKIEWSEFFGGTSSLKVKSKIYLRQGASMAGAEGQKTIGRYIDRVLYFHYLLKINLQLVNVNMTGGALYPRF